MRSQKLDAVRGIAILGMVLFHAHYLLTNVFGNRILDFSPVFWSILGKSVAIAFMVVSGISFFLFSRNRTVREIRVFALKRSIFLGILAGGISFATFTFFPEQRIVFGIIHFFAVSSILMLLFTRFGTANIWIGICIAIIGAVLDTKTFDGDHLPVFLWIRNGAFYSADYYPLFPWFGVVLSGYGIARFLDGTGQLDSLLAGEARGGRTLALFGRWSLLIYMVHVPVLYGIFSWMSAR